MMVTGADDTHLLISFRSHFSPAQYSVFTSLPSPVFVTPQVQTKHVRPALEALTHCPRPEQEVVPLLHASRVAKHVETPPIGNCGGAVEGRGAWLSKLSWRLTKDVDEGIAYVRTARLYLSSWAICPKNERNSCAISEDSLVWVRRSVDKSIAANAGSSAVSKNETRVRTSSRHRNWLFWKMEVNEWVAL